MFYERLNMLCKDRGISITALAKELNISTSKPTAWKNGSKPRSDVLLKLANYFDVSVDYLIGVEAPSKAGIRRIPVYGRIPAGIPLEAIEDITDYEEELEQKLSSEREYIALRVRGDSMTPEYKNDDVIIVRLQDYANTGDDAVVFVNNADATLKRISVSDKGLTLRPLNSGYEPMFFTPDEVEKLPVRILGIVVQLRRNMLR